MAKTIMPEYIKSLTLKGYRPFRDITIPLDRIEVIVGANGSGKSSLFEFLKFLRDAVYHEIPPEIVAGSIGQQIFHRPGPDRIWWNLEVDEDKPVSISYQGELLGPVGKTHISFERVETSKPLGKHEQPYVFMD
jgi:energy-coupling factor transporter ATP-binding protein EcfA2